MRLHNGKNNVPCTTVKDIIVTDVSNWYFSSVNAGDVLNKVQGSA